jgi:hypothetical protein
MSKLNIFKVVLCCFLFVVLACMPAASSESLAESKHPYSNNFEYTWSNISEPGATEIRLHFSDLDIGRYDKLTILDKYGNDLVTYSGITKADFWTEWYVGDTLGVRLITSDQGTAYGFKIDKLESRSGTCISNNSLAESYHPYANNFEYKWPDISKPGATQIRIHFESLNLADTYDKLILYDKYDNVLKTYNAHLGINYQDFWTEWYTGDTLKVKLITGNSGTAYGFKIDKGEIKNDKNVTTVFTESAKALDPTTEKVGNNSGEYSDDLKKFMDRFHSVSVEIAVTLNILEEEDNQSWMYRNIQWVFSGIGTSLGASLVIILMKRLKDKKIRQ